MHDRPSGSTTAALISILHSVTALLTNNDFVVIIALDFGKAFDTVRHSTLLAKLAQLDLPDEVYNWLVDYFAGHKHLTQYGGATSTMLPINASIVQGSGIGLASYVVNAADLRTTPPGNRIAKYADDTYLIIPACNVQSRANELNNVEAWAKVNNLRLNHHKSVEIVVTDGRRRRLVDPPPTLHDVSRVTSVKILGVTFTCKLSLRTCQCYC